MAQVLVTQSDIKELSGHCVDQNQGRTVTWARQTFIKWLEVVLFLVLIYSLFIVFAGTTAGSLFSWFGFGPDELIDTAALSCMTKERHATVSL
jgi:hypothetical protein